jgi:hypothetical protein
MALGCRENAVVWPLVVLVLESRAARSRWRAVVGYVVLLAVVLGYLGLRQAVLGGTSVPPRPYVIPPGAPDFARFVVDKALYYILGEFLLFPCVPISGLVYLQERPWLLYGCSAAVLGLLGWLLIRTRAEPAARLGLAWLMCFMLPVLPVFVSPHHLYLPGIGWALLAALILQALGAPPGARRPRCRRVMQGAVVCGSGLVLALATFYFGLVYETGLEVEDRLVDELASAPGGLQDGETLYLANFPLVGHYARLALEDRTGRRGLRIVPLMWAPRVLGLASPAELTFVSPRVCEVRVADERYFAGPLGALVHESTGNTIPQTVDRTVDLGLRITVLDRDPNGIVAWRFEFTGPRDPRLFWGSRVRWAGEVRPSSRGE